MKAAILFGDSSVTLDKPIGERNNSPVVIKKYPRKTKRKGTFPFSPRIRKKFVSSEIYIEEIFYLIWILFFS